MNKYDTEMKRQKDWEGLKALMLHSGSVILVDEHDKILAKVKCSIDTRNPINPTHHPLMNGRDKKI